MAAVLAAAAAFVRWPAVVPLAVLVTAPLRPPLVVRQLQHASSCRSPTTAGSAACCRSTSCSRRRPPRSAGVRCAVTTLRALPRTIALPAAAFFAFACCSLLWADDVEAGTNLLLFFTLPFAALLATVARADYPDWTPRWLAGAALGDGVDLRRRRAVAGRDSQAVLLRAQPRRVEREHRLLPRDLAVRRPEPVRAARGARHRAWRSRCWPRGAGATWPLIGLIVLMWAGLLFSYSQSSMIALLVVTLALAVATGDARIRRGVAVLAAAALLATCAYVRGAGGGRQVLEQDHQ